MIRADSAGEFMDSIEAVVAIACEICGEFGLNLNFGPEKSACVPYLRGRTRGTEQARRVQEWGGSGSDSLGCGGDDPVTLHPQRSVPLSLSV